MAVFGNVVRRTVVIPVAFYLFQFATLYSSGVIPVTFLKVRLTWLGWLESGLRVILPTVLSVLVSCSFTFAMV